MLNLSHLAPSEYLSQTWKSGKGQTQQIAVEPSDPFGWRVSLATLEGSGTFSSYSGYDRNSTLLKGGPLVITHPNQTREEIFLHSPFSFRGEEALAFQMKSPGSDFNVFTLRGRSESKVFVTRVRSSQETQFALAGQEHFLFTVSGNLEILESSHDQTFVLGPQETLRVSRLSNREYLNLRSVAIDRDAVVIWVVIRNFG